MLKGERVTLRAVERDDLKRLHELEADVDLVIHGNGVWYPQSLAAFEKEFDKHLEDREPAFMVIEVDNVIIGSIGLHHSHRRDSNTEFGIGIYDPAYVGRGYGTEAIHLLLRWAFQVLNYRRVYLTTASNNPRAIRAYEKCGFVHEGRLRDHIYASGEYADLIYMGMMRSEWEGRLEARG